MKFILTTPPLLQLGSLLRAISLTFHKLSEIISWKYTMLEIIFMVRISSWNFVRVPKASLLGSCTKKVLTWNFHNKYNFWNTQISRDFVNHSDAGWLLSVSLVPFSPWQGGTESSFLKALHTWFWVFRTPPSKGNTFCYITLYHLSGLILGLHPANERLRYKLMPSLIGWVQAQNQHCILLWPDQTSRICLDTTILIYWCLCGKSSQVISRHVINM